MLNMGHKMGSFKESIIVKLCKRHSLLTINLSAGITFSTLGYAIANKSFITPYIPHVLGSIICAGIYFYASFPLTFFSIVFIVSRCQNLQWSHLLPLAVHMFFLQFTNYGFFNW